MTPTRVVRPPVSPMARIRNWLLTGLIVLAPSALTLYVFFRLLNAVDNLLGRYLRFKFLDYHRIPGAGLLATRMPEDVEVVFVPSTPNPASGFVHYVPRSQIVFLDWPVEYGLQVIVSGGVVQPDEITRAVSMPQTPPAV